MTKILQNKYIQLIIVFIAGGVLAYLFLPTKIETRTVEKIVNKNIVTHQVKIIKPDGTSIETNEVNEFLIEALNEQIDKVEGFNERKFLIYSGMNPLHYNQFVIGASYNVWGPMDIGASYQDGIFLTVGIRF